MSERIPPKFYHALSTEIRCWRDENLISHELAEALISRYPIGSSRSSAITFLSIIGAVLIGLGALLYIGANWHQIATIWKLTLIVMAIVASHLAGWTLKYEPGNSPRLGTAFLLLGSLFFGGGIWLIAQMFNIDVNFENGLLLWFAGTCASAYVTRSAPVGILASLILGAWTLSPGHINALMFSEGLNCYHLVFGTIAGLAMGWFLRSRSVAWITLLVGTLEISIQSGTFPAGLLFWGFTLWGGYLWMRSNQQIMEAPFKYVGIASALSAMLFFTCNRGPVTGQLNIVNYAGLLVAAIATLLALLYRAEKYRTEAFGSLLLLAYFLLFQSNPVEMTRVVAFNFMLVCSVFGLATLGLKRLQNPGLVNIAIVFAVLDIICRYFDFFFSMMDRSLFFIVGGIVLMIAGAIAEQSRRQLLEGLKS